MSQTAEILIAEESPTEAEKLKRVLEQHKHRVTVEHSGELALASIRQQKPKIVISDTELPKVNGFELCRQIKGDENLQRTFVILLTTLSDPRDVIRGLECGADNFIAKGFDEKLLLSRIENILLNQAALPIKEPRTPLEILLGGESYFITPDSQQMATLLISTYEAAVQKNVEYLGVQEELKSVNERLENEVQERTAELRREISNHRAMEKAKLESQQQYESLVNSLDGIVWELDAQTFRFTFVSEQAERMLGYPREQWTTDPNFWTDHLHRDDKWAVNACIESIADRKDHQLEYRMIAADGRVVWFKDIVTVERLEGENPRVRGVMFEITASKLAEEEKSQLIAQIESHRQRLDAILTNLPSVIWESWNEPSANGQPLNFVSDYVETMLGYSVEEWVSKPNFWLSIVHPEDRERVAELFDSKLGAGKSRALEFRWIAKNGRVIWVEAQAMVIRDRAGKRVGFRGVGLDITELKRAERALMESEERLRQSQKMEAIGTLAGGVAHDFNNLLTAILGNTQLAMRKLQNAGSAEVHLVEVEKAGNRAASLTRQLLAFSRRQHLERRTISINEIILEIMRLLKRIIGEDVEVEVKCADDLPTVFADPAQIEQVIMNLGANARDAMPQGGKLTIETGTVELDECYCRQYPYVRPGHYVQIIVSDTGEGMDEETQARVFEPFFTTKEIGKGTGLGLPMVYGILKQHHGHINLYSELGQGSTFKVFLPVNTTAVEKETQTVQYPVLGGPETILVAEDEEALRTLASEILKSLGYTVLLARNGQEAVQIYAENRERIDIVLLDCVMPVMSGSEVYKRIREMGSDVPLLIMTGHSSETVQSQLLKPNDSLGSWEAQVIQKPYNVEVLGRRVREVLDQPRELSCDGKKINRMVVKE